MSNLKSFDDGLDTAVFTTTFVMLDKREIVYVTHDSEDGAWQFFSDDNLENVEDYAMVVGLRELIKMDETILNIADLPLGYFATRKSINDTWTIGKQLSE